MSKSGNFNYLENVLLDINLSNLFLKRFNDTETWIKKWIHRNVKVEVSSRTALIYALIQFTSSRWTWRVFPFRRVFPFNRFEWFSAELTTWLMNKAIIETRKDHYWLIKLIWFHESSRFRRILLLHFIIKSFQTWGILNLGLQCHLKEEPGLLHVIFLHYK